MTLPRLSASLIATSLNAGARRVLMVQRARRGAFPDALVFPGGMVEPQDYAGGQQPTLACALRETLEETGLALAKAGVAGAVEPAPALVARWVTPRSEPRRFATDFYRLDVAVGWPPGRVQQAELTRILWVEPQELLEMNRRGSVPLFPPQFCILSELSRGGLSGYRGEVEPVLRKRGDAVVALLPGDREYPGAEEGAGANRLLMTRAEAGGFVGIEWLQTGS
ncbi:hypothetical protein GGI25_003611 [Coemansia spiralis]|uniref:Nudix hydrolase domain-containing protein n=2 Tax=Coemansia TaxID=4863 RepID=A0A9W8KWB0_9FUNG|nr:NUDIX domain-containing protein [Coemansia spiralis]KAJ1996162.1 hypothetical protein EDC05_000052 [Coemansia umbellata]KAJ2626081.1 hypothetical protein GGI26_000165 [Coemansia sp. RSA 1358]KAJ2676224.1 hypothetical protein GGI25_003611 [Coemansia spiralis]